jgi:protein-S-isoprenylcysteine O-methyltransferase Ste14
VHLGRRQPGAVVLRHGLEHIVDELLDLGRADSFGRDRLGDLPQHRMAETRNLQDGHAFVSQIGDGVASQRGLGHLWSAVADLLLVTAWLVVVSHNVVLAGRGVGRPIGPARWAAGLLLMVVIVVAGTLLERVTGRLHVPLPVSMLGVTTACAGALLHVSARRVLGAAWSSRTASSDVLVEDGPYGVVRNPLYLGIALLTLGTILAHPSRATIAAGVGVVIGVARKIALEERALAHAFGPRWESYRARVPRFVPRLRRPA